MTKTYELPKGRKIVAEFDENGIAKITEQALDSLICELNEYAERQKYAENVFDEYGNYRYHSDIELSEPNTATSVPCGDAISREDAEQMFRNIRSHLKPQDYKSAEEFNTRDLMLLNAEQMIHALPSVTQKSGKWIKIKSGDKDFPESIVCSRCSNENSHLDFNENAEPIGKVFVTSKFCPNCGAKMVEPQEKRCADCNHYGKLSLDCGRCDDNCSMFEPQESEDKE